MPLFFEGLGFEGPYCLPLVKLVKLVKLVGGAYALKLIAQHVRKLGFRAP